MKLLKMSLLLLIFASCKNKTQSSEARITESALNKTEFSKTPIIESELDKLQSESDIEQFIRKSDTDYLEYELKNIQDFERDFGNDSLNKILATKHGVKTTYEKADFDNNGYTDLLAIGDDHTCSGGKSCSFSPIVVMNYGPNKTNIFSISLEWEKAIVPKVEYIDSQPFLVVYEQKLVDWKKRIFSESKKILTFKYGNFIEYNKKPKNNKISKIEFSTSGCYGTCPVYKLTLNKDSLSIFNARYYNFKKDREVTYGKEEGVFFSTINDATFEKLEEILNYCDFENLEKDYSVMHTDDQTATFNIVYNNGKVKTIRDYGMVGTYGLDIFYRRMAALRFNEKWKKK